MAAQADCGRTPARSYVTSMLFLSALTEACWYTKPGKRWQRLPAIYPAVPRYDVLFDRQQEVRYAHVDRQMKPKSDVLQGTLDLLVLRTLDVMGSMHGYGIAQRIQQISEDVLQLNQGTLYPALLRLEQQGWIQSKWGVSENNRRARYYSVTRSGRKQLAEERASWDRVSGAIKRLLEAGA